MPYSAARGHAALRRGRWSSSGSTYFLTICSSHRQVGLSEPRLHTGLIRDARAMEAEHWWHLRAACIMPDHVHLLIALGGHRGGLPAAVRRWKGRTAVRLRASGLHWQRGYFDHRVRPKEDIAAILLYLFLNPYRAGLVAPEAPWPAFHCCEEDWAWFRHETKNECPPPEWLR